LHGGLTRRSTRLAGLAALLAGLSLTSTALGSTTFSGGVGAGSTSTTSVYGPTLRMGSTGRWVNLLQQELTFAGFRTPIDGQFGLTTKQSVNAFKRAHGLWPNGVIQRMAWGVLESTVKAVEASVPPGAVARLNPDGTVTAPTGAPAVVQQVIAAANRIAFKPYIYGGGHGSFTAKGYDCSGSVSYALHGAGLLSVPEDSGELESYGAAGPGQWITLYANGGHVYMRVAGLWFDTAAQSSSNNHDRWSPRNVSGPSGFVVRHPVGY
jgi:peptidoglycan hydrolase-like protein with peptidoglycan-binding domain